MGAGEQKKMPTCTPSKKEGEKSDFLSALQETTHAFGLAKGEVSVAVSMKKHRQFPEIKIDYHATVQFHTAIKEIDNRIKSYEQKIQKLKNRKAAIIRLSLGFCMGFV